MNKEKYLEIKRGMPVDLSFALWAEDLFTNKLIMLDAVADIVRFIKAKAIEQRDHSLRAGEDIDNNSGEPIYTFDLEHGTVYAYILFENMTKDEIIDTLRMDTENFDFIDKFSRDFLITDCDYIYQEYFKYGIKENGVVIELRGSIHNDHMIGFSSPMTIQMKMGSENKVTMRIACETDSGHIFIALPNYKKQLEKKREENNTNDNIVS